MSKFLKTLSILVAVLFALGVVLTAGGIFFFGSSKVRPLFGMSAEALAGDKGPDPSQPKPIDLDALAKVPDAGVIRVR